MAVHESLTQRIVVRYGNQQPVLGDRLDVRKRSVR